MISRWYYYKHKCGTFTTTKDVKSFINGKTREILRRKAIGPKSFMIHWQPVALIRCPLGSEYGLLCIRGLLQFK